MIEKWDGETSTIVPYVEGSGDGSGATPLVELPDTQKPQNQETTGGANSTTQ